MVALLLAGASDAEDLSVVSYNVHGLPAWIARDEPALRMPVIGKLLSRYDTALVQEVWGFHAPLAESIGDATQLEGNGPRTGLLGVPSFFCGGCGAGLSFFSSLPRDRVIEVAAEPYDLCSDWIVSGNDCWARKGFLFVRVRLSSGVELDFYDTHLEAGDDADDLAVRAAQLEKLRAFAAIRSVGRAVILGGDLNLAYDQPVERALVERFATALGLRDTGARPADLSRWKNRIDWIFSRDGKTATVALLSAGEELSFVREAAPLSDHPAVFARFRVEARR